MVSQPCLLERFVDSNATSEYACLFSGFSLLVFRVIERLLLVVLSSSPISSGSKRRGRIEAKISKSHRGADEWTMTTDGDGIDGGLSTIDSAERCPIVFGWV
jgi:hypothetical protein